MVRAAWCDGKGGALAIEIRGVYNGIGEDVCACTKAWKKRLQLTMDSVSNQSNGIE